MSEYTEKLKAAMDEGLSITKKQNAKFGMSLMEIGFRIIPSPYIEDDVIVVSQKVYDAIKTEIETEKAGGGDE